MNASRVAQRGLQLGERLAGRILVLDGAGGTMLQGLAAPGGTVDELCLTAPDAVRALHRAYLAAGADIIKTNSFNATRVVQADHGLAERVRALNRTAAALARSAADEAERAAPGRPRFVAGVLGPTHRLVSPPARLARAGAQAIGFDLLVEAYAEAAEGLLAGGADLLLIESVCDIQNARAAIQAVQALGQTLGRSIPLIVSATVGTDGHTLTGPSIADFWEAVGSARPVAIGLNCAFGVAALRAPLQSLAQAAGSAISVHPSAGLPDAAGNYPDGPETMAAMLRACAEQGLVNIVGGCCGTTPAHVAAIAAAVRGLAPRRSGLISP